MTATNITVETKMGAGEGTMNDGTSYAQRDGNKTKYSNDYYEKNGDEYFIYRQKEGGWEKRLFPMKSMTCMQGYPFPDCLQILW